MQQRNIKVKIYCSQINFDNCTNWRAYMQYSGHIDGVEIEFYQSNVFYYHLDELHDIIVFIRPLLGYLEYIKELRKRGKKVIVDFDDSFPLTLHREYLLTHLQEGIQIINECDLLTTTTDRLKEYFSYHTIHENIAVLPNVINPSVVDSDKYDNGDNVVLGWYGSSGHYESLESIQEVVNRILIENENVFLNLYSDNEKIFNLFQHERVRKIPYNFNFTEFQKKLGEIDINLAPLIQNYFNLHKSNIRIILPGYKGIPSVTSNFGPYQDIDKHNVLLCNSKEDWFTNLNFLIKDSLARKHYGDTLRKLILENYTYQNWVNFKLEMFKKLVNDKL